MAKQASNWRVDRWRQNYWLLRKKYLNKEIAQKLDMNDGNLSALAKGTKNKKGIAKTPGTEFLNQFYMIFPELPDLPDENPADPNENDNADKDRHVYEENDQPTPGAKEAAVRFMTWDDPVAMRNELFSMHKRNDEFLRTEFSKMTKTGQTAVNAFDKMAESNLILSQEVAFYRKKTDPN